MSRKKSAGLWSGVGCKKKIINSFRKITAVEEKKKHHGPVREKKKEVNFGLRKISLYGGGNWFLGCKVESLVTELHRGRNVQKGFHRCIAY